MRLVSLLCKEGQGKVELSVASPTYVVIMKDRGRIFKKAAVAGQVDVNGATNRLRQGDAIALFVQQAGGDRGACALFARNRGRDRPGKGPLHPTAV